MIQLEGINPVDLIEELANEGVKTGVLDELIQYLEYVEGLYKAFLHLKRVVDENGIKEETPWDGLFYTKEE